MKILAITAGRTNGSTYKAISALTGTLSSLAKADGKEVETEIIQLGSNELLLCRGCRVCFEKGEGLCPRHDSLADIAAKMSEADALIMASPIYVEDVTGSMKNLIDRLAYNCYRPAFFGKPAFVVTTSGVGATHHAPKTMTVALGLWGFAVIGAKRFRTGSRITAEEFAEKHGKAAAEVAKKLYTAMVRDSARKPSARSLITFAVQQKSWSKAGQGVTRDYWQRQGWLDPRCTYYMPHKKNRVVTAAVRAVGRVIAAFFV